MGRSRSWVTRVWWIFGPCSRNERCTARATAIIECELVNFEPKRLKFIWIVLVLDDLFPIWSEGSSLHLRLKSRQQSLSLSLISLISYISQHPLEMFAAATSFFSRSNISQNYTIGGSSTASSSSRTATPAPVSGAGASSSTLPAPSHVPPFQVGLWRVQSATHKVTGKRVSVWTFDKRNVEVDRLSPMAKDKTMDVLKAEVRGLWMPSSPQILTMSLAK